MNMGNKIKNFIDREDKRLKKRFRNLDLDPEKDVLARTVKLVEEVGELCEEVLSHNALQRRQKLNEHNKDNIQGEFADVVFTTLLLAKSMKIDVDKALLSKLKEIDKRHGK